MNYIEIDERKIKAAMAGFKSWFYLESNVHPTDHNTIICFMEKYPNVIYRAMRAALNEINLTTDRTPAGVVWRELSDKRTQAIMTEDSYREASLVRLMNFLEHEYSQEIRTEKQSSGTQE